MKVETKGPNENTINYIAVLGVFINRWSLVNILKRMPGVKIKDSNALRSSIKERSLAIFEYEGHDFIIEPEPIAGNELEIRQKEARPVKALLKIKNYLASL